MRNQWVSLQRFFDLREFKKYQADYFLYVSQLLQGTQGQYTMRSVFAADIQRYGPKHYRGRLSAYWLSQYQKNGGNLAQTWKNALSTEAWLLLKISQVQGSQSLMSALETLTLQLQERKQFRNMLSKLFWPVGFALALLLSVLFLMPWFTVPQLQNTFYAVPEASYGFYTRSLFAWAHFSQRYGVGVLCFFVLVITVGFYSLPLYVGRGRVYLDYVEPWRSYKALQSLATLKLITLLLEGVSRQLRLAQALQLMQATPNKWLRFHLKQIELKITQGETGAYSFDVGLLSKDMVWFLADMEQSQDLVTALGLTAHRLQQVLAQRLPMQAQIWRWFMLLFCVATLLLIGGWHYAVIDELRRALLMFYAS